MGDLVTLTQRSDISLSKGPDHGCLSGRQGQQIPSHLFPQRFPRAFREWQTSIAAKQQPSVGFVKKSSCHMLYVYSTSCSRGCSSTMDPPSQCISHASLPTDPLAAANLHTGDSYPSIILPFEFPDIAFELGFLKLVSCSSSPLRGTLRQRRRVIIPTLLPSSTGGSATMPRHLLTLPTGIKKTMYEYYIDKGVTVEMGTRS